MEDRSIVQLYLMRNEEALSQTENKYGAYIGAVALNILGNLSDMDEAKNDVLMALWNSIPPNEPENLKAFLDLTCEELDACMPERASVEEALNEKELKRALSAFLSKLSDDERRVFICRYFYGDGVAALAKNFCFSQSKVKMMLKRTRDKLRSALEKEEIYL